MKAAAPPGHSARRAIQAQTGAGIPSSYQQLVGRANDWDPSCPAAHLGYLGGGV